MAESRSTTVKSELSRPSRWLRWFASATTVLLLAACGGGNDVSIPTSVAAAGEKRALSAGAVAQDVSSTVRVSDLVKKSETRVSRTVYEYEYALTVTNSGPELQGVEIRLTRAGAGTALVEGISLVDRLPAKGTLTTTDTIRVRHDRLLAFRPDQLVWQVTGLTLGPVTLAGKPSDTAIGVMTEMNAAVMFPAAEFDLDLVSGSVVLRTKIAFGFKEGTTVGQVNTYLADLGATIVRTYDSTAVVEVKIPDPGSVTALIQVLTNARRQEFVSFAVPMVYPLADALPPIYGEKPTSLVNVAHHLAVRGAQAWNARRAPHFSGGTPAKPVLLIADYFGDGNPVAGLFNLDLAGFSGTGFNTNGIAKDKDGIEEGHGYHVLGIAAGMFGGSSLYEGKAVANTVTGLLANESTLLLEVLDLQRSFPCNTFRCDGDSIEDKVHSLLRGYENTNTRLVLNTSLGYNASFRLFPVEDAVDRMNYWLHLLRGQYGKEPSPIELRLFHAASAGNDPSKSANLNAGWTRGAMTGMLQNTAVVENRMGGYSSPFGIDCLAIKSSKGGNLSAIGDSTFGGGGAGVYSYSNAAGALTQIPGTSMAAPCPMKLSKLFETLLR